MREINCLTITYIESCCMESIDRSGTPSFLPAMSGYQGCSANKKEDRADRFGNNCGAADPPAFTPRVYALYVNSGKIGPLSPVRCAFEVKGRYIDRARPSICDIVNQALAGSESV